MSGIANGNAVGNGAPAKDDPAHSSYGGVPNGVGARSPLSQATGPAAPARPSTITCFLCGGTHVHPGPRFENHLLHEHGVVFNADFFVKVSLFKQEEGRMPKIEKELPSASKGAAALVNGTAEEASGTFPLHCYTYFLLCKRGFFSCRTKETREAVRKGCICANGRVLATGRAVHGVQGSHR